MADAVGLVCESSVCECATLQSLTNLAWTISEENARCAWGSASMQLLYEWEPEEWREALMLASAGPRRSPKPVMTYAVISMMAAGSLGELVNAVRASREAQFSGSLLPLLLFAAAIVVAMQIYTRAVARRRRLRPLPAMPKGPQHVLFSEEGWRVAPADAARQEEARPWAELQEQRKGRYSLILLGAGNTFAALPLRVLNATQGGFLNRLLIRKLHRTL